MSSTRKILRAFLASPGDLQDERKAIHDAVTEFNTSLAEELGYHVELVGWEETIAGYGRPQHLINQDLDRCDLFIGMIWKRWGTPPDPDGEFTSGFHEEFERSVARRKQSGSPEISLFFKEIPEEFIEDPGDDLKRVLDFRDTIIKEKKILFQKFSTERDMEMLARKCVSQYVIHVKKAEFSSESDEPLTKRAKAEPEIVQREQQSPAQSPLSAEGFTFLKRLVGKISQKKALDDLSASEVARFRLLANSISKPGNEKMSLGVHDLNLLFFSARFKGMRLGQREINCLASLGFQNLSNENVPLWYWYSALSDTPIDRALISSLISDNDDEKVGAISVLESLARKLPTDDESLNRTWILNNKWFSEDSSARVRSAALSYLAKNGIAEDYPVAKNEYDRSDHGTFRRALECMVGILLRTGKGSAAQQLVLESQFESLDTEILQAVLDGFEHLETAALLLGLKHRNARVRLHTLRVLSKRRSLDQETAEPLTEDSDASIRSEAIKALSKLGRSFTQAEVKEILARPRNQPRLGIMGQFVGEELFERYQLENLKKCSEVELAQKVDSSLLNDNAPYFARVEKYFTKHSNELRSDVDNTFGAYWKKRIRRIEKYFGQMSTVNDLVKSAKELEDWSRKKLTRRGLDILCRAGKHEDLKRIRANLQGGYAGVSKPDADYLRKHGEWTDILLLVKACERAGYEGSYSGVAEALFGISRGHSVSILLSLELPAIILKRTIELCAESRFLRISQDTLFALLDHESEDVRKATAIKSIRAFSTKRIKSILHEYVHRDTQHYYNVVHWLDLGASMSRDEARRVAGAAVG